MFTSVVFTTILASSAVLLSQAIVEPNEPGPGESFNEGQTCHIGWDGDDSGSTTAWKNMAIQLMTGSNEQMVPLTTVATGQDGSVAGTFDYTCPEVTPNSPIYFYQFVSGETSNVTWTTRFTIAGTDGSSTNATQSEQADGQTVFYGTGALVDPSTAVPPPTFNTTGGSSDAAGSSNSASGTNSASGGSTGGATGGSSTAGGAATGGTTAGGAAKTSGSSKPSSTGSSTSSAPSSTGSSAAGALVPMDARVWPFVAALTACAMTFTILL